MSNRQTMTVSLPTEMIREVERVRKTEHRTRSEVVREALRLYLSPELAARITRLPVYVPTKRELREIEKGRAEIRRGEYLTLNEFFRGLVGRSQQTRPKTRRARAKA